MVDIGLMLKLFGHRRDLFSLQQKSGAYFPCRRPLTEDEISEHLAGFQSVGTYVLDPADNTVRCVLFDLDIVDEVARDALCCLVEGLTPSPTCLMLEFSGGKGWHVWLFLGGSVSAARVRRWVARDFMPKWQALAAENGWPAALEVFPKQDSVSADGYGNLVKLPLGVHARSGVRSRIEPRSGWAGTLEEVEQLGLLNVPNYPEPEKTARAKRTPGRGSGPTTPFPCVDHILRNGVGSGVRDNAAFHLALYLYGHGVDEDLAGEILDRANENFDPPLSPAQLNNKLSSAYGGRYESAACGTGWLADICPGPCQGGWHVKQAASAGALSRATVGSTVEVEIAGVVKDAQGSRFRLSHPDASNSPTLIVPRKG